MGNYDRKEMGQHYDPFLSTQAKCAEIECADVKIGSSIYALIPDESGPQGDGVWHIVHIDAIDGDKVTVSNRQTPPHGLPTRGPWTIDRDMIYRPGQP